MTIQRNFRVLVFNPNTSKSVTESFKPTLSSLRLPNLDFSYWTCPTGPTLIKTQEDMYESASHCLPLLLDMAEDYDGFLGACYADHPIVRLFQSYVAGKPVVGIFDASVLAAAQLTKASSTFGIVTTGLPFESLLTEGVKRLALSMGPELASTISRFGGVAASRIGQADLGIEGQARAREKIMAATTKLIRSGPVDVICVGGVILGGMEAWIREACELELGRERNVVIIEQLSVGALMLHALLRNDRNCDFAPALR